MSFDSSARINPPNAQILARAEFESFAPAPCVCMKCCVPEAVQTRTYAHVYENRFQINRPLAPFGCLTQEICIIDMVQVTYFDRPPTRSGMCCFCIPCTCCGPPVIFSLTPKLFCLDLKPCFGQQVMAAPANCYDVKKGIFCCNPCYTSYALPLLQGVKNAEGFVAAIGAAVDAYRDKHGLPQSQMATVQLVNDNFGDFGGAAKVSQDAKVAATL